MPVATHEDVQRLARRKLTPEEAVFAAAGIEALTATLERFLNRVLDPREITETVTVNSYGQLIPHRGPVVRMLSASAPGYSFAYTVDQWASAVWPAGVEVDVTYLAGRDPDPGLRDTIAGAVARTILTPAIVALGVVGSYSVEGTLISYRAATEGGRGKKVPPAEMLVGELRSLGRLRRPVLL